MHARTHARVGVFSGGFAPPPDFCAPRAQPRRPPVSEVREAIMTPGDWTLRHLSFIVIGSYGGL